MKTSISPWNIPFPFWLAITLSACFHQAGFQEGMEKNRILEIHQRQRDYHFQKDSVAFVAQFSDQFISVNKGKISRPTKAELQSKYHRYFSSVNFIKWDDLKDPEIRFSSDGTLAYTIVDKLVVISFQNDTGNTAQETTHFAWTTIYKKYGHDWKIDCVISTEETL